MNYSTTFISFYSLSSFICFLIDICFPNFRVKPLPQNMLLSEYSKMLPLCSVNAILGTTSLALTENYLIDNDNENNYFFFINFMLWLITTDFFFYFTHRLFHEKIFYKYHAIHHNYNYTFGIGAIYAHPIDFFVTNIFPVTFPIVAFNIPHHHGIIITIFSTCYTTIISHGGFKLNQGKGHLIHHVKRKHNYGLIFFDRLLGTYSDTL